VDNPASFAKLAFLRNAVLRNAITRNLVSFPSQIRPFAKRTVADLQVRIVQLYFIGGWSVRRIGDRYNIRKDTVHQLLAQWRIRAIESGYIQEIEPGVLTEIVPEEQDIGDIGYLPEPTPASPQLGKMVFTTSVTALMPSRGKSPWKSQSMSN
jgi:transposase-like protein